jgi:hypothetical protein
MSRLPNPARLPVTSEAARGRPQAVPQTTARAGEPGSRWRRAPGSSSGSSRTPRRRRPWPVHQPHGQAPSELWTALCRASVPSRGPGLPPQGKSGLIPGIDDPPVRNRCVGRSARSGTVPPSSSVRAARASTAMAKRSAPLNHVPGSREPLPLPSERGPDVVLHRKHRVMEFERHAGSSLLEGSREPGSCHDLSATCGRRPQTTARTPGGVCGRVVGSFRRGTGPPWRSAPAPALGTRRRARRRRRGGRRGSAAASGRSGTPACPSRRA